MMENKNFDWNERTVMERKYPKDPRTDWTRSMEERNLAGRGIHLETAYPGVEYPGEERQMWRSAVSDEDLVGGIPIDEPVEENYLGRYNLKRAYADEKNSWEQHSPKRSRGGESSQAVSYTRPRSPLKRHDEPVEVVSYTRPRSPLKRHGEPVEVVSYTRPRSPSKRHIEPVEVVNSKEGHTKIKMAIINRKHPDLVIRRGESELVQAELERIIDAIPAGGASPQFQGTRFEAGVLWVSCANAETKDWLVRTIDELEPLWEGGALRAVGANNLPMRSKVLVWIPGSSAEEDVVRTRLKIQNPTLMTEDWQPLSRKVVEKGQTLAFSIDQESFEVLKRLGFRPYWGLARVTFTDLAKRSRR